MKRTFSRKHFTTATAAALASVAIIKAPAKAAQFTYKYANNAPLGHPLTVRTRQAIIAINAESGGRLELQLFPNNQLGGDTAMLSQLRSGAIQFFTLDGGILESVVPVAGIQGVGFAFKNDAQAFKAMDGSLGAYVRNDIESKGLWAHPAMWANGMRNITTSTHPIRNAGDLANFKIRTPPGALWVDLFKSFGASPSPINFNEVYTALQTKIVDGQENPYAIIQNARLFEVQKYLSITNHMWSGFWMLGNMDAWKALPPDLQKIIAKNFEKYALLNRRDTIQLNDSLADKLRREGLTFNVAETGSFRAKLGGFYKKWKGEFGSAAWGRLESYSGKLG